MGTGQSGDEALLCAEKGIAYFQVGRAMCAEGADAKVQAQILGHFTSQLVKPGLSQRETAAAVEAVGALAASTNRFFGEQVRNAFTLLHHQRHAGRGCRTQAVALPAHSLHI